MAADWMVWIVADFVAFKTRNTRSIIKNIILSSSRNSFGKPWEVSQLTA